MLPVRLYTMNPETGKVAKKKRKVVNTDPKTIGHMAVDSQEDMLVAFCDKSKGCRHRSLVDSH